jgi:hypothetical protein
MNDSFENKRRAFLKAAGVAGAGLVVPGLASFDAAAQGLPNPIVVENAKQGTYDWGINNEASSGEIEGFVSTTSAGRGETIALYVNTPEPTFEYEVFRIGWYGGVGARRVAGPITRIGQRQPIPTPNTITGLTQCSWKPFWLYLSNTWVSGIYLIRLTGGISRKQNYMIFVLRDDIRLSQLYFQSSVTTFQAYNNWGGKSLYEYNSTAGIPAVKVSFDRPYATELGTGEFFSWEFLMVRFLEREGYDVSYCTDIDTHARPALLTRHKAFLSVGHDEYWTYQMRQNVLSARDQRVHLAFFGANDCYWQIRLERNTAGGSNRTMVCYKERLREDAMYGVNNQLVTTQWRDPIVNLPEEQLIGTMFDFYPVHGDIVVDNASHWIFAGTGLTNGDRLTNLLGYEADRIFGNSPQGLVRLAHSPLNTGEKTGFSDMTIYTAPSNAFVFAAGSMQFLWGLDDGGWQPNVNPAAQKMTRNLLARFV